MCIRDRARTAAVGAGLAETGDPEHDQAWVDLAEHVQAQAPGLHRAGAKVLHQDVALGDQLEEQLQAAPLSQVDGDRLAVAGLAEPGQRGVLALGRYAEAAHRVTGDRVLDLDDLGTELAHDAGGVGAGEERADVDDPYPAQRQPGGWLLLWHQAGLVSVRPGPTARGKVTVRRWWSLIVVRAAQGSVPAPTGPRSTVAMAFGRGFTMRGWHRRTRADRRTRAIHRKDCHEAALALLRAAGVRCAGAGAGAARAPGALGALLPAAPGAGAGQGARPGGAGRCALRKPRRRHPGGRQRGGPGWPDRGRQQHRPRRNRAMGPGQRPEQPVVPRRLHGGRYRYRRPAGCRHDP